MYSFKDDRFLRQNSEITIEEFSQKIFMILVAVFFLWQALLNVFQIEITDYFTPVIIGLVLATILFHIISVSSRLIYQTEKLSDNLEDVEFLFECEDCGYQFDHIVADTCRLCDNDIDEEQKQMMINAYYLTEDDLSRFAFLSSLGLLIVVFIGMLVQQPSDLLASNLGPAIPLMILFLLTGLFLRVIQPQYYPNNPFKAAVFE